MEYNVNQKIVDYIIAHKADWGKVMNAVETQEEVAPHNYEGKFITILDSKYPDSYRNYYRPSFALFYEGDIALLKADNRVCVRSVKDTHKYLSKAEMDAIVDALMNADADAYVVNLNDEFLPLLLEKGEKLIVVSDKSYDLVAENADLRRVLDEGGLFITETPNGVLVDEQDAKMRATRLMANIETEVVVASCKKNSSVNVGVCFSVNFGHRVIVAPLSMASKGLTNNQLLGDGAEMLGHYDFAYYNAYERAYNK